MVVIIRLQILRIAVPKLRGNSFTLKSKGGVGKSLHTYCRALSVPEERSLFVDVDSSTQTSTRQLKFLGPERLETISLLVARDVLVRDKFLGYMESLAESNFERIYMDFGAPESEQIPALIQRDIPFKEFCDELGFEVAFNIIIGGGGAYKASVDYLQKLVSVVDSKFETVVWENITSFNQSLRFRRNWLRIANGWDCDTGGSAISSLQPC